MATLLFNHIAFGPIKSRRLGNSLGINLLPKFGKWCSFDCIYCECGWNKDGKNDRQLPSKEEVFLALDHKLKECKENGTPIDTITFSGNGEPTLHPDFPAIIDRTLELRDRYYPTSKVSVLTNASQLDKPQIRAALQKTDNPILKIDSPLNEYVQSIDRPSPAYSLARTIENIKLFDGDFILQTMFLRGEADGKRIDSTDPENCRAWRDLVRELKPREIMMYTIDRETPAQNLSKVTVEEMEEIARPLKQEGYRIQIKG